MKCPECSNEMMATNKWKRQVKKIVYLCDKCGKYWFAEDSNRKIIIKDGVRFYNIYNN